MVKCLQHGRPLHRASVIGMKDKWLLTERNLFGNYTATNKLAGMYRRFLGPYFPGDNLPAEKIQEEIQVEEHPFDRTIQVSDIPHPNLIGSGCAMGRNWAGLALCSASPVILHGIITKDPIDGRLGCEIDSLVSQYGYNFAWGRAFEFGRVDYLKNVFSLLFSQLVCGFRALCGLPPVSEATGSPV